MFINNEEDTINLLNQENNNMNNNMNMGQQNMFSNMNNQMNMNNNMMMSQQNILSNMGNQMNMNNNMNNPFRTNVQNMNMFMGTSDEYSGETVLESFLINNNSDSFVFYLNSFQIYHSNKNIKYINSDNYNFHFAIKYEKKRECLYGEKLNSSGGKITEFNVKDIEVYEISLINKNIY